MKSRITDKIGLQNTVSGVVNNREQKEARPYKYNNEWLAVKDLYFPNVVAVGDILSTTEDLVTFINALMAGSLTSMESLIKMRTFEGTNAIGMGLAKVPFYEKTMIGHDGGTLGTYSVMYTVPEDKVTVAYTINGLNYKMNDITIALLSAFYNKPYQAQVSKTNFVVLKSEDLDALLGNYSSKYIPLKISITSSGNVLIAQAAGQPPFFLNAASKDEFRYEPADVVLQFNREKREMTLLQGGATYLFTTGK